MIQRFIIYKTLTDIVNETPYCSIYQYVIMRYRHTCVGNLSVAVSVTLPTSKISHFPFIYWLFQYLYAVSQAYTPTHTYNLIPLKGYRCMSVRQWRTSDGKIIIHDNSHIQRKRLCRFGSVLADGQEYTHTRPLHQLYTLRGLYMGTRFHRNQMQLQPT